MIIRTLRKFSVWQSKLVLLAAAFLFGALKPGTDGNEYQVKAMFIFNFTKYVEWPEEKEANVFTIGILGESEITEPLIGLQCRKSRR